MTFKEIAEGIVAAYREHLRTAREEDWDRLIGMLEVEFIRVDRSAREDELWNAYANTTGQRMGL